MSPWFELTQYVYLFFHESTSFWMFVSVWEWHRNTGRTIFLFFLFLCAVSPVSSHLWRKKMILSTKWSLKHLIAGSKTQQLYVSLNLTKEAQAIFNSYSVFSTIFIFPPQRYTGSWFERTTPKNLISGEKLVNLFSLFSWWDNII